MQNIAALKNSPIVSVVMAVRNGGDYIYDSLNSVIHQTFSDFEIIIIDDGSEDNTLSIIESIRDSRIKIYSQKNRGVARSANRGLALARGKYIARIDHDDFWIPDRLEKQVAYLRKHSEIGLVGSAAVIRSENMTKSRHLDHPTTPEAIQWELLFNNPFVHSSILFRKEIIKKIGLYCPRPDITPLDDYHFISRVAAEYKVANLKERLVIYNEIPNSLTSNFRDCLEGGENSLLLKLANLSTINMARINNLPVCHRACITFGRVIHGVAFSPSLLEYIEIVNLMKSAYKKIYKLSSILRTDEEKLLSQKLENFQYKYINGLNAKKKSQSCNDLFQKALIYLYFFLSDINANSISVNTKQIYSNYYWSAREFIYHKMQGKFFIKNFKHFLNFINGKR